MIKTELNHDIYIGYSILIFFVLILLSIIGFKISNEAALLFFILSFNIFLIKDIYSQKSIFYSMTLIMVVHQIAVIYNVFFGTLPGARGDAIAFSDNAIFIMENDAFFLTYGSSLFQMIIAWVYKIFGQSYFMLSQLILLFFSYTCFKLLEILHLLGVKENKYIPLLFFGLLPSAVIHFSIPLREVFEVGFIMIYFNCLYKFVTFKKYKYLLLSIIPFIVISLIHKAMLILALGILLMFIFIYIQEKMHKRWASLIFISILSLFLVSLNLNSLFDYGIIDTVINFRESRDYGNTSYNVNLENTVVGFIFGIIKIYYHYLFGPFIWDVSNIFDLTAAIESLIRLLVLYKILQLYFKKKFTHELHQNIKILLSLFLIITVFWSLGTSNYGTAVRHHLLDWWILCIFIGYLYNNRTYKIRLILTRKNYDK
ncbi:hypothetical protein N8477_06160 [Candidatus Thioglobus sp.]|nr:hypothetical protein [Candidatus Thioglobus sp.]